jgi:hypothetical protein
VLVARFNGYGNTPRLERHIVRSDDDRVKLIFRQAVKDILTPQTRGSALADIRPCASRDEACELQKLYSSQYRRIKYVADIHGVDTYQRPSRTDAWGAGDCDDHVSRMMARAASIGFPVGARVIAVDGHNMSHIMPLAAWPKDAPRKAVVLDTTVDGAYPGWQPPARMRRKFKDYWLSWDENGKPTIELGDASGVMQEYPWIWALVAAGALAVVIGGVVIYRRSR